MPRSDFDLDEAAEFVRHDFRENFLPFLHDWELFERDLKARLLTLKKRSDSYTPCRPRELPIPKTSLFTRPAGLPVIDDWVLYTAATNVIARKVESKLIPTDQEVLFSFRWNQDDPTAMVRNKATGYSDFRSTSLELLDEYPYALETDIASYFENIDFKILRRVLLRLGAIEDDVAYLVDVFLSRWTYPSRRGIPQGPWASSYLGNVYLDSVDKGMSLRGHKFLRYVDDMRIFCATITEAKKALLDLTELTREIGLTIQAAKTTIYNRDQARESWRGYRKWLEDFKEHELRDALQEHLATLSPYGDFEELEPLAANLEQEKLEELFRLITRLPAYKLDRKGLEFLLREFLKRNSDSAVEYSLSHLKELPHLAPACAEYLTASILKPLVQYRILEFLRSEDCLFDWQAMHLMNAFLNAPSVLPGSLQYCLHCAADKNRDVGLRSICIDVVARHGSEDHIRELCRFFTKEGCDEVRGAIVLASRRLQQMEKRAFLGACRGFSPVVDSAVEATW